MINEGYAEWLRDQQIAQDDIRAEAKEYAREQDCLGPIPLPKEAPEWVKKEWERMVAAQVQGARARQQEKEGFRPIVRETARREALRADDQFIAARLKYYREIL